MRGMTDVVRAETEPDEGRVVEGQIELGKGGVRISRVGVGAMTWGDS